MTFEEAQNSASKIPVTEVLMTLDWCANTFSVAPCTATGVPCYNTYFTCKDKPHFSLSSKQYKFINAAAPQSVLQPINAKPYLQEISFMGAEVQDNKTITARVNLTFADEPDFDQTTDPYWQTRNTNLLNAKGTFWKKLLERNPFYKGRSIIIKEGYAGVAENLWKKRFDGKIDNITRDGNKIKIECVDDIADLSKVNYPFVTNKQLAADVGACFNAKDQAEMLKLSAQTGDFCIRTDFIFINTADLAYASPGGLTISYMYEVFAYDTYGRVIGSSEVRISLVPFGETSYNVTLSWTAVPNAVLYRVYKVTDTSVNYLETASLTITDNGALSFPNSGLPPSQSARYFRLNGNDPADLNSWNELTTPPTIDLNAVVDLATEGYLEIEDEVIYYNGIVTNTLQNVERLQFKTKADKKHYALTNINLVLWKGPTNPFILLEEMLILTGIPSARIDTTTIHAYRDAYTGIFMSCKPIIKSTTADKIIFDLCYDLDVKLWVNEDGQITVKDNADDTVNYTITDDLNIIINSESVDFNQSEIFTRIPFRWNRIDVTKSIIDAKNYGNLFLETEPVAESNVMYDKEIPLDDVMTVWINDDSGTAAEIAAYISALLNKKINRGRMPRPKFTFDVEVKDSEIKVGNIISLSSDAFNDITGNDYTARKAEVIKKEPKGNRVSLTVRLLPTETVTTESENQTITYENPLPYKSSNLGEIKVINFKIYDLAGTAYTTDNIDVNAEVRLKLEWDNMYASTAIQATDILGVTRYLAKQLTHPIGYEETYDLELWKTTKKYNVYMFMANTGQKYPVTRRPTSSDANGKWFIIGTVFDIKSGDVTKKYTFEFNLPISLVGRYLGFAVYADTNLVYDPDAPVGIEIGRMQ